MTELNNFLYAIQNPKAVSNPTAPTNDLTPTVPKQLTIVQEIAMPTPSGDIMAVYFPYSTRPCVQLYQKATVSGSSRYVIWQNLLPDQDLNLKYNKLRLVSGYLALISNTISTTNSNLSGSVNMVLANDLPRFSTLNNSALSTYANLPKNFLNQAKLSTGVTNLFMPTGSYRLRQLMSPWPATSGFCRSLTTGSSMTRYSDENVENVFAPNTDAGWSTTAVPTGFVGNIWSASTSSAQFPLNLIGRMRATGTVILSFAGACVTNTAQVSVVASYYSSTAFTAVTNQVTVGSVPNVQVAGAGDKQVFNFEFDFESCTPLFELTVSVTNNTGANVGYVSGTGQLKIELFDTKTPEFCPAILNTISGASASQVISYNMYANYDAVPDPSLNQDIKPYIRISDITEIDVARYMCILDPDLRATYTDPEFGKMLMSAMSRSATKNIVAKAVANAQGTTGAAADWGGFLSVLKSIGKVATNVLPGVIGAFNPAAGMIAANVANAIAPAFATDVQRGYTTDSQFGYTSDEAVSPNTALPKGYASDADHGLMRHWRVPPITREGDWYHCDVCDEVFGREGEFRPRLHADKHAENVTDKYCAAGLCCVIRSKNRVFPPYVEKDVHIQRLKELSSHTLQGRWRTATVSADGITMCVNCLGRVDESVPLKFDSVGHSKISVIRGLELLQTKGHATDTGECSGETAINEVLKEFYAKSRAVIGLPDQELLLSKLRTRTLDRLYELGASTDTIVKALGANVRDPEGKLFYCVSGRLPKGKASDKMNAALIAKFSNIKPSGPQEANQLIKESRGFLDHGKVFGAKPDKLPQAAKNQLAAFNRNPLRSGLDQLSAVVSADKGALWWFNKCIVVHGQESSTLHVACTFMPVASKGVQVVEYQMYDTGLGLQVGIDKRLEDQGVEVARVDSPAFKLAEMCGCNLYFTANMPTQKGKVFLSGIVGHSWYMAAYAAQYFAPDTLFYTGSIDVECGDIGDKVLHVVLKGSRLIALNCPQGDAEGVDLILKNKAIPALTKAGSFTNFIYGEPDEPQCMGYYINKDDWGGPRSIRLALAAAALLGPGDEKIDNVESQVQREINMEKYGNETASSKNWQLTLSSDEIATLSEEFEEWWSENEDNYMRINQGKGTKAAAKKRWMQHDEQYFKNFQDAVARFGAAEKKPKHRVQKKVASSLASFREHLAAAKQAASSQDDDDDGPITVSKPPAIPPKKAGKKAS